MVLISLVEREEEFPPTLRVFILFSKPTLLTSSQPENSQRVPLLNHGPSRGRASASGWDG